MIALLLLACTPTASDLCDACGGDCVRDSMPSAGADHVEGTVDYPQSPPSSGDHAACWTTWGVHEDVVAPENWVHNLEHGGIVFLYDCPDGCDGDVATLTDFVDGLPTGRAVLTAYSGMEKPFAAVAWEHRLLLGCADTDALRTFFDENVANAPEDDPDDPAGSCAM